MMKQLICTLLLIYSFHVYGNDLFIVNIKLSEDNFIVVNVKLGNENSFENQFCFLDYVPGNYEKSFPTAYINNVKATYKNGSIKKVKIKGNKFILLQPKNILELSYQVNQNDQRTDKSCDFPAAGNVFDSSKKYLLNFHSFIGFNNQNHTAKYSVTVHKNSELNGYGSLVKQFSSEKVDSFAMVNFQDLIDSPMFYSFKNNHQLFNVKSENTEISFLVNSNQQIDSLSLQNQLFKIIEELEKSNSYKHYLPKKYHILVIHDPNIKGSQGALEHPYSSIYFYNSQNIDELELLKTVCHEILHIKFPLALKSSLTSQLNNQEQSKHLWLYEGVTEYQSLKLCLASGIIDTNTFFIELYKKSLNTKYYSNFNMPELSTSVLTEEGSKNFSNFYDNGALFAFLLDVKLSISKENGIGINGMLDYISKISDSSGVFDESHLISEIVTKFPVLKECFEREMYNQISLVKIFDMIGVKINPGCSVEEYFSYDFQFNKVIFFNGKLFHKPQIIILNSPINTQLNKRKIKIYSINNEAINEQKYKVLISSSQFPEMLLINDDLTISRNIISYHKKTYIVDKELFISEFGKTKILTF